MSFKQNEEFKTTTNSLGAMPNSSERTQQSKNVLNWPLPDLYPAVQGGIGLNSSLPAVEPQMQKSYRNIVPNSSPLVQGKNSLPSLGAAVEPKIQNDKLIQLPDLLSLNTGGNSLQFGQNVHGQSSNITPINQHNDSISLSSNDISSSNQHHPYPQPNRKRLQLNELEVSFFQDSLISDVLRNLILEVIRSKNNKMQQALFGEIKQINQEITRMIDNMIQVKEKIREKFGMIRNNKSIRTDLERDSFMNDLTKIKTENRLTKDNIQNLVRAFITGKNRSTNHASVAPNRAEEAKTKPRRVKWQYRHYNDFRNYNPEISEEIEKAYQRRDQMIIISIKQQNDHYIDFKEGVQKRMKDGDERQVRRVEL